MLLNTLALVCALAAGVAGAGNCKTVTVKFDEFALGKKPPDGTGFLNWDDFVVTRKQQTGSPIKPASKPNYVVTNRPLFNGPSLGLANFKSYGNVTIKSFDAACTLTFDFPGTSPCSFLITSLYAGPANSIISLGRTEVYDYLPSYAKANEMQHIKADQKGIKFYFNVALPPVGREIRGLGSPSLYLDNVVIEKCSSHKN